MKPNLHPEQAKALYREIANDAGPRPLASQAISSAPSEDGGPISDNTLELAITGFLALVGFVVVMAAIRSFV